jgi:hypothetical protein
MRYIYAQYIFLMRLMMRRVASRGFVALVAICMLTSGTLAGVMMVMLKAHVFADVVTRREARIQKYLDIEACIDTLDLMKTRDPFLKGKIYIRDFDCRVYVDERGFFELF